MAVANLVSRHHSVFALNEDWIFKIPNVKIKVVLIKEVDAAFDPVQIELVREQLDADGGCMHLLSTNGI